MNKAFELAGAQLGLNETDQKAALQDYLATGGQNLDPAEIAWCAAFVNASLEQGGIESTGKLNARSYLDWGQEVSDPQQGDIAVFSRGDPNGWQGHVGFFDGYNDDGTIRVLGGNQSDSVSVASYDPNKLLGFRRSENALTAQTPPFVADVSQDDTKQVQRPQMQNNLIDVSPFLTTPNQLSYARFT